MAILSDSGKEMKWFNGLAPRKNGCDSMDYPREIHWVIQFANTREKGCDPDWLTRGIK